MVDFKEALVALANLAKLAHAPSDYNLARHAANLSSTIRSALEAAQQEAEAWEAIDRWLHAGNARHCDVTYSHVRQATVVILFYRDVRGIAHNCADVQSDTSEPGVGRVEALQKCAAWCRAQPAPS